MARSFISQQESTAQPTVMTNLSHLATSNIHANETVRLRKGSKVSCIEAWFGNVAQIPKF